MKDFKMLEKPEDEIPTGGGNRLKGGPTSICAANQNSSSPEKNRARQKETLRTCRRE